MPVSTAQALVPRLVIVPADAQADAEGFEQLAVWVMQGISPIVVPDPLGGIVVDTIGPITCMAAGGNAGGASELAH